MRTQQNTELQAPMRIEFGETTGATDGLHFLHHSPQPFPALGFSSLADGSATKEAGHDRMIEPKEESLT
jgi:hypothetical protein